jgi:hypothetical protein
MKYAREDNPLLKMKERKERKKGRREEERKEGENKPHMVLET